MIRKPIPFFLIACFVAFIISCLLFLFLISCVPHELESPETPKDVSGKADITKSIKTKVENELAKFSPYLFSDNSVPLDWVWQNIGYKSFDYKKFFATTCPSGWINGASWLNCDETGEKSVKKFSVSARDDATAVEIKNLFIKNSLFSRKLEAYWEIRGGEEDFTVTKYEKITSDVIWIDYSIIKTRFIRSQNKIIASGKIGSPASGAFSFETDGLIFSSCQESPDGLIFFQGKNQAMADFYEAKKCAGCVPVAIDGYYGRYAFCGPWPLQDLFDYLKMFIQ